MATHVRWENVVAQCGGGGVTILREIERSELCELV